MNQDLTFAELVNLEVMRGTAGHTRIARAHILHALSAAGAVPTAQSLTRLAFAVTPQARLVVLVVPRLALPHTRFEVSGEE